MSHSFARRTGQALFWKATQLVGVKSIFFLRTLVLARLLVPDDFGLLAMALASVAFLTQLTDFGMMQALVQRKELDERHYDTAWTINVTRTALISGIVILSAPFIAGLFSEPRATAIIRVVALQPLIMELASIGVIARSRELDFRALSIVRLTEAVINTACSIALAPLWGVWALVAGTVLGALAYMMSSYVLAPHRPRLLYDKAAARSLIQFGRWIFMVSFVGIVAASFLRVVISRNLGTDALGLYFLAGRLAFLPSEIAGELVGAVALPLYSRLQERVDEIATAFRSIMVGTLALLVPLAALIVALIPSFIAEVLGEQWNGTVPLIRILTVVGMIGLIGDLTGPVFQGLGKPSRVLALEMTQSLVLVVVIWELTARYGVVGAALASFPATVASQALAVALLRGTISQPFRGTSRSTLMILALSILGGWLAHAVDASIGGLWGLIAAMVCGSLTWALLWLADRRCRLGLFAAFVTAFSQVGAFLRLDYDQKTSR